MPNEPKPLTAHFHLSEFEHNNRNVINKMPPNLYPIFIEFCNLILEPIREHFDSSVIITSGYRNSELNKAVGGAESSQHKATEDHCAADIQLPDYAIQDVFDWIRLESGLPFDQIILERGRQERHEWDDCIHISYSQEPRRMALLGPTHGQGSYQRVTVLDKGGSVEA